MKPNSITITYLSKVSFASLNGGDKEVDNIVSIKKIKDANGFEFPYMSSQAVRRALRDKIKEMGWAVSEVGTATEEKGAAKTACNPAEFIDDDLFGFMDAAKSGTKVRTSPVRVEALLALSKYQEDLDYGTNFMAVEAGGNPNIFETEIHSGIYRGTILIELDRVGVEKGKNKIEFDLSREDRAKRVHAVIDALQMLWSTGRQSRFLADISPKFVAAAYMNSKNPIFLEAVNATNNGKVNIEVLKSTLSDYSAFIESSVLATQDAVFGKTDESVTDLKSGFEQIKSWVNTYYEIKK